jgi:hypothetical protein
VNRVLEPLDHGFHVRKAPFDRFKTLLDRRPNLIGAAGIWRLFALESADALKDRGESQHSPFQLELLLTRRLTPPHSGPGYLSGLGSTGLDLGLCAFRLLVDTTSLGNGCTQPLYRALPVTPIR